ncbi:MAG: response regulator [Bacteroidota bacterium]
MDKMDSDFKYKRVMVVEDSEVDRYIAAKLLQKNRIGEDVICMPTATDALCYLRSRENAGKMPEFILLDIRMPEMDGFEFLDIYATLSAEIKSKITIAMLSSSADPRDLKKAKANPHVCCFVSKPLTKDKLQQLGSCNAAAYFTLKG